MLASTFFQDVSSVDCPYLFDHVSSSPDGFHMLALTQSGHILQWTSFRSGPAGLPPLTVGLEHARVIHELQGKNVVKVCAGCGNL